MYFINDCESSISILNDPFFDVLVQQAKGNFLWLAYIFPKRFSFYAYFAPEFNFSHVHVAQLGL